MKTKHVRHRKLEGMADGGGGRYPKTNPALLGPPVWKVWRPTSGTDLNRDGTLVWSLTTGPNEFIL